MHKVGTAINQETVLALRLFQFLIVLRFHDPTRGSAANGE